MTHLDAVAARISPDGRIGIASAVIDPIEQEPRRHVLTPWRGREGVGRPPGCGSHLLVMAEPDQLRAGTRSWVEHELDAGAKVFYKGWIGTDVHRHWMFADRASPASAALANGQLEFLDYPTVVRRARATTAGLAALQHDEVRRAVDEGWPTVALAQETTYRPMGSAHEVQEFRHQEQIYSRLSALWPVNTLCQLSLDDENDHAIAESVAVHHREVLAATWSGRSSRNLWCLSGDLDVAVRAELDAALAGLLRAVRPPRRTDGESDNALDVDIDLQDVSFMDVACARALLGRAASTPARVVLRRSPALVRELLEHVGPPSSVVFAEDDPR